MTETVNETASKAVAKRDTGPRAMVAQYAPDFRSVLPSHVKPEQWVRVAQGALKKGKRYGGDRTGRTELEVAAANNPAVFLASLLDAARLGLEPGTEQYYLTPRKTKGKLEILGIVGYQGYIELMYRAGAVASVVAECVYTGDRFQFRPGIDERPIHEIDWDDPDRGKLRLAYAYAVMKDGATSKVVVLNAAAIAKLKARSAGSSYDTSPWQTDEPAMWLKSCIRQLAKWVPTSAEYRREQLRAERDVAMESPAPFPAGEPGPIDVSDLPEVDEDVLDAELVDPEVPADDDEAGRLAEQIEMEAELAEENPA
jgi:recombination protein RecT